MIDIEKEFHHVVRAMGGVVVADILSKSPPHDNADYVFHDQKLVAELKCLNEDRLGHDTVTRRIPVLWERWLEKKWVVGPVPRVLSSEHLPKQCTMELIRAAGKSIRRQLEKANRQIRATIKALRLDGYKGAVFVANNNNRALRPAMLVHFLFDALKNDFSAIDSFVVFSTFLPARYGSDDQPALFWFAGSIGDETLLNDGFMKELHERWASHCSSIFGIPVTTGNEMDMGAFWKSEYF